MKSLFFLTLIVLTQFSCTRKDQTIEKDSASTTSAAEFKAYWTCPMHPEIHKHEAGKCPICGMPLIEVKQDPAKSKAVEANAKTTEASKNILTNQLQLTNSQIPKYLIEKKDFHIEMTLIGRMTSNKEITFQIYESDLLSLKTGLSFSGFLTSQPENILKGQFTAIDKYVDPSSRTVKAIGVLSEPTKNFLNEATFNAKVQILEKNQIVIPEEAVLHTGTKDLVYVFSADNMLTSKPVVLGQKSQGLYQVLSGLNAGESISAGANFLIDSEAKIRGQ